MALAKETAGEKFYYSVDRRRSRFFNAHDYDSVFVCELVDAYP